MKSLRIHELWPPAGSTAPFGMTKATRRCEQHFAVDVLIAFRSAARLLRLRLLLR
jgi:hypothetical protein